MNDADLERLIRVLASAPAEGPLPDAGAIWAKAALRQRLDARERATLSIRVVEKAAAAVAIAGAILWFPTDVVRALDPAVLWLCGVGLAVSVAFYATLLTFLWADR